MSRSHLDHPLYLVVGAGFSGAVIARQLAENLTCHITVIDSRDHIAGNCHTSRDPATGVMIHHYGPHIFNTSNPVVWQYANRFAVMKPYIHRVKALTANGIFPLPINLLTINSFFGRTFRPDEARAFISSLSDKSIKKPENFEEQALKMLGRELYEAFLHGYTKKQWGCEPRELPASVLKRLPVRFNYDDNYHSTQYQGIPEGGYSDLIQRILDHPSIEVRLRTPFSKEMVKTDGFSHVFYTGPLDAYFDFADGRLGYRTMEFERIDAIGDYQGATQINFTDLSVPWTRMCEHKHFMPWEQHERTVVYREYSRATGPQDIPYYPVRLKTDKLLLKRYRERAALLTNTSFLGRLATYRYMDMETVIGEALVFAEECIPAIRENSPLPHFPNTEL